MALTSLPGRPAPLLAFASLAALAIVRVAAAQIPPPPHVPPHAAVVRPVRPAPVIDRALLRALRVRPELTMRPVVRPVAPTADHVSVGTRFAVGADGASSAWLEFTVPAAGRCVFEARWTGDLAAGRLTVRDPAGNELHAPGASPLRLELDVAAAQAGTAATWRVTIEPGASTGTAHGELTATLPKPATPAAPAGRDESCAAQRELLDDGSVRLTYADGTIVTYHPGGGFTVHSADGVESRAMCMNIPPTAPPALPDDPQLETWLTATNEDLLDQIRELVKDAAAVDRYVSAEAAGSPTVYEQIRKRIDVLGKLR